MTYAVRDIRAHIERGKAPDSFGQTAMYTLCGKAVYERQVGHMVGMSDPMFYPVCGRCRQVDAQRKARLARSGS